MKHINFTDLRVFLAIADTGNLTRAAAQCCITPSAASVRLKHLEEEAGCSLVTRLPRGLALTSAGERLAAEARKVFQQITRMTDAMTAFCGDERLVVRLAANYNAAVAFLPDDLSGFLLKNPEIRIDQRLLTSRGVAEVIALGEADIGITASSDFHGGLCFYPYREDSLVLFAAHDHPLVKRGGCRFEEALEEDFVALSNEASMQTFMLAKAVELHPIHLRNLFRRRRHARLHSTRRRLGEADASHRGARRRKPSHGRDAKTSCASSPRGEDSRRKKPSRNPSGRLVVTVADADAASSSNANAPYRSFQALFRTSAKRLP